MTRDEIDELIKYLEKKYHVKGYYWEPSQQALHVDDSKLVFIPDLKVELLHPQQKDKMIAKEVLTNKLDKLDLIRF